MKNKVTQTKISELIPDNLNANKGTEYGQHLIEKSFREFGAGRSILLDRNNRIIGGNKSVETASAIGLENVIIVETTGDQIVAVKRTDIDLDSVQGRSLALADNATSKANLAWDAEAIQAINEQWEIKPEDWGIVDLPDFENKESEPENQYSTKIEAPSYEVTGEKPAIEELADESKCDELVKEIMASNISNEDKRFLSIAAKRHVVFNYSKIAEYYAHASKQVQELMERNALVIIDFDKAIENGFIQMTERISEQYVHEYGDEE